MAVPGWWPSALAALIAGVLYINTLGHDFVYDDNRAILSNDDVIGSGPLWHLLLHDFWGTPLRHGGSHGSYRPLTVLTFRLTAAAASDPGGGGDGPGDGPDDVMSSANAGAARSQGSDPAPPSAWAFHVGNVALHAATAAALAATARRLCASASAAAAAGALFAAHPAPSEAVAGVVGRADLLAGLLALLALLVYVRHVEDATGDEDAGRVQQGRWLACVVALAVAAMLAKEQGVMALPLCAVYDVLYTPLPPHAALRALVAGTAAPCGGAKTPQHQQRVREASVRRLRASVHCLALSFVCAVGLRALAVGGRMPEFATADNPAAKSDSLLTRSLTFLFLPAFNFGLLLFPRTLSFDWSMDAVPLVRSVADPRAAAAFAFYCALALVSARHWRALHRVYYAPHSPPTSPPPRSASAAAAAFHVDVNSNHECHLAERTPPATPRKGLAYRTSVVVPVMSSCCPFGSVKRRAGVLSVAHRFEDAAVTTRRSVERSRMMRRDPRIDSSRLILMSVAMMVLPFLPATNLVAYVGFVVAERLLYVPAMGYCLLLGHGFDVIWGRAGTLAERRRRPARAAVAGAAALLFAVLAARTLQRCADWKDEESLYRSGLHVNPPKAYGNLGNVLSMKGRLEEAEHCYRMALKYRPNMADVHYNLGILLQNTQRWQDAIASYQEAIRFRPYLAAAHLNLGLALQRAGRGAEAVAALRACAALEGARTKDPRAHELSRAACRFQLGRLAMDAGRPHDALRAFQHAVNAMPPHYQPQSLYNLMGEAHSRLGHDAEAERWFQAALSSKPDHVPAHLTYGRLLARNASRIQEAERWYRRAEILAPEDAAVFRHYGQFLLSQRRAAEAAPKLLRALELTRPAAPLYEDAVNAATALRLAGDLRGAEEHYRLAVRLKPEEASGLANLGALYHLRGRLTEAEQCYERALQLQPGDAVTQANLQRLRRLQVSAAARRSSSAGGGSSTPPAPTPSTVTQAARTG